MYFQLVITRTSLSKNYFSQFHVYFSGIVSFGQTSVNTAGGEVENTSGSVSYSIGQVAYTSVSNSNGSVSQGVQHAFEICGSTPRG